MKTLRMLVAAVGIATVLIVGRGVPMRAQSNWTVVMSGLDNPRGLTFVRLAQNEDGDAGAAANSERVDDGWALYVAEAGRGGDGSR